MNSESYESILDKEGTFVYTNSGNSMYPLIRPKGDLIVIKKPKIPLNKYDIPLYKRKSGEYVLHRVIAVKNDGYVIRGDNCTYSEKGIADSQIVGVLYSVIRGKKEVLINSLPQKIYAVVWNSLYIIRKPLMLLRAKIIKSVR